MNKMMFALGIAGLLALPACEAEPEAEVIEGEGLEVEGAEEAGEGILVGEGEVVEEEGEGLIEGEEEVVEE